MNSHELIQPATRHKSWYRHKQLGRWQFWPPQDQDFTHRRVGISDTMWQHEKMFAWFVLMWVKQ